MTTSTRVLGGTIALVLSAGAVSAHLLPTAPLAARPMAAATAAPEKWSLVSDVVASRRLPNRDGRLLAVRSRRVLDAHAFPAELRVAGRRVAPTDLVRPGARVEVIPGKDRVEPLQRRRLPAQPLLTRVGKLTVSKPRVVELTVGAVSGEEVARRVLLAPVPVKRTWDGEVLLTFDDGPDPTWTPQVLALLKAHRVHAVFCLVGREARKHPDLVRRIVREGHTLCGHTENHDEHLSARAPAQARSEVLRGADALRLATGVRPLWFRAPGGGWSPQVEAMVRAAGMTPLKWTVDPRDWERPPAHVIVERVLRDARPGSVILLHDGGGDRRGSVAALRRLLVALPRLGLTIAEPQPPAPSA